MGIVFWYFSKILEDKVLTGKI